MPVAPRPGHVLIGDCTVCGKNGLIMKRTDTPDEAKCLKCMDGLVGTASTNSFREEYKEQLEKFSTEVYELPLEDVDKLIDMAKDSFREELYTMPTEHNDLVLLVIQYLTNELISYKYIDTAEYNKIESKYNLNRLGRFF